MRTSREQAQHEKEYREIEARYFNPDGTEKPGAMLAPNGERSNLGKRQWIQVRTSSFKKWFGDWERLSAQQAFDAMTAYKLSVPDTMKELTTPELRKAVEAHLVSLARNATQANHPILGAVDFTGNASGKTINRSHDPAKLYVGSDIVNVLEKARYVTSEPSNKQNKSNELAYHTLINKINVFGHEFGVLLTVKEDNNGKAHYNHIVVIDKNLSSAASPVDTLASRKEHADPAYTELDSIMRPHLQRVNPNSVSKVVDANGEPMVVYHGTRSKEEITNFDTTAHGPLTGNDLPGSYFTPNKQYAWAVGYTGGQNKSYEPQAVFLDIKNPAMTAEYSKSVYGTSDAKTTRGQTHRGIDGKIYLLKPRKGIDSRQMLEGQGFKGVIRGGPTPEYIAFSPTQIKSATENTGAFDGTNPDIRYSRPLDNNHQSDRVKEGDFQNGQVDERPMRFDGFASQRRITKVRNAIREAESQSSQTDGSQTISEDGESEGTTGKNMRTKRQEIFFCSYLYPTF